MSLTGATLTRIQPCVAASRLAVPLSGALDALAHIGRPSDSVGQGLADDGAMVWTTRLSAPVCAREAPCPMLRTTLTTSRWKPLPVIAGIAPPGSLWGGARAPTGRSFASQAEPAHSDSRASTSTSSRSQPAQHASEPEQGKEQGQGPLHTDAPDRPPNDVTYIGPLAQQHKLLKRISITNTLVALAAAPAIVAWADNISMVSRYGLAVSLVFFGILTTGALHWVAHPYIHELRYQAATGQIEARTTTLLGNSRWHTFNIDDVRPLPWNRPVATFTARNHFYYIDTFSFRDEQLLRRLTPDEADVPKGYKDKEDEDED